MLGWCIDANDLEIRLGTSQEKLHNACRNGRLTAKGVLECNCWCHTGQPKPTKRVPAKRKRVVVAVESGSEEIKLNKDGTVPKKRGRPKGSKNKPKPVPIN